MSKKLLITTFFCMVAAMTGLALAQSPATTAADLRLHLVPSSAGNHHEVRAVVWLEALPGTPDVPFPATGHYTLLQKNRTFMPHLQVIPVGAAVQFPNADPFFHNVFSLFDGKRFDLGLYEAGSSKSVTFSRKGVSYIFCNIHPEMSAVIVSLSSPLFAIAASDGSVAVRHVPLGTYEMRLWVEGVPQSTLDKMTRPVDLSAHSLDLGDIALPQINAAPLVHANKFGSAYDQDPKSPY